MNVTCTVRLVNGDLVSLLATDDLRGEWIRLDLGLGLLTDKVKSGTNRFRSSSLARCSSSSCCCHPSSKSVDIWSSCGAVDQNWLSTMPVIRTVSQVDPYPAPDNLLLPSVWTAVVVWIVCVAALPLLLLWLCACCGGGAMLRARRAST